jgi:hypothetical protein
MQYNPLTKTLWGDDGNLPKKIHCPKAVSRDQILEGAVYCGITRWYR